MLDTIRKFEVPEGVDLELRLAGPVIRINAWLIDFIIRSVIQTVIYFVLIWFSSIGWGLILLEFLIIEFFYPVLFELHQGATPGKKILSLYVCHDDGTPVNWQSSMLRNLLRVADFLPFAYATGLITMLINRDFKRLGDLAAGTVVVYRGEKKSSITIPSQEPIPLPLPLTLTEQRSILDFAERFEYLSIPRQQELSNILTELTNQKDDASVKELHKYANWLLKGQ
jgi:uncharacterized RDD family membrane protein YckC